MKRFADMLKLLRKDIHSVESITKNKLKNKIKILQAQEKILFELLYNPDKWGVKFNNPNQGFFITGFANDTLQTGRTIRKLILKGDYNSAGSLLRNIFEISLLVEYFVNYDESWLRWLEYQNLIEEGILIPI